MPETLPSARVLLGTADGDSYGYKRPVSIYARVELRRQSGYGSPPREKTTTDGRTVRDPLELSVTFAVIAPNGTDIGGGAMGEDGMRAVTDRTIGAESWKRLARLIPWHLNGMSAGCVHQIADGWDKRPIDPAKPTNAYGRHFPGQRQDSWNLLGWVRQDEHSDGLMCRECPECGYRYGTAWLCRELPAEIIADVVALGQIDAPAPVPFADLIAEFGISATVRRSRQTRRKGWDDDARHWTVTLRRGPRNGGAVMSVPFSQGSAHTDPPTLSDVLECLASDCSGFENYGPGFEDWASAYGYDEDDSRGPRRIFAQVTEQAVKLRDFLGDDGYAALTGEDA